MKYLKGLFVVLLVLGLAGCPNPGVIVTLTLTSATLDVGESVTIGAASTSSTDTDFVWSVEPEGVVTLSADAGTTVTVTAVSTGVAEVMVIGSGSGVAAKASIAVPTPAPAEGEPAEGEPAEGEPAEGEPAEGEPAEGEPAEGEPEPDVTVSVTPAAVALLIDDMITLTAASSSADDADFNWTIGDDAVVSLSAETGLSVDVTALAKGTTTVTATGTTSGIAAVAYISVLPEGTDPAMLLPIDDFEMEVLSVEIPADLMPVVTFTITDGDGNVIPLFELSRFSPILAYLDPAPTEGSSARYMSYTTRFDSDGTTVQATTDGAGLDGLSDNGDGTYSYKFATAIPADYNPAASHMLSGQVQCTSALSGVTYTVNPLYAFRPDGSEEVTVRNIVDTDTCNKCHTRLEFHGGSRREVGYCILCHNPGSTDGNSGNTVDMPVMIHKIHHGAELPSVQDGEPYQIVGHRDTVYNYSEIEFPQDIRNCTVCHESDKAAQADVWMTAPTKAGCASCHDRTWFGTEAAPDGYEAHPTPQANDAQCAICHNEGNIIEAHTIWQNDEDNTGLNLAITSISADPVTGMLVIGINATYDNGSPITDLDTLSTLSVNALVGWPSWEYDQYVSENVKTGGVLDTSDATNGNYVYTFTTLFPTDAGLSFGIVMTGRNRIDAGTVCVTDDSITYFTIDGSEPVERRMPADVNKCNTCHYKLELHGGQRTGLTTCVICHNTLQTDEPVRPAEALPVVTVNFKDMIHKIHAGAELENGYLVYGYGGSEHDYGHVHFPGKLSVCTMCHEDGTYELPVPEEAMPTVAAGVTTLPEASACTDCHDSLPARIHGMLGGDTASGAESCATCHGAGAEVAVDEVHAMAP